MGEKERAERKRMAATHFAQASDTQSSKQVREERVRKKKAREKTDGHGADTGRRERQVVILNSHALSLRVRRRGEVRENKDNVRGKAGDGGESHRERVRGKRAKKKRYRKSERHGLLLSSSHALSLGVRRRGEVRE